MRGVGQPENLAKLRLDRHARIEVEPGELETVLHLREQLLEVLVLLRDRYQSVPLLAVDEGEVATLLRRAVAGVGDFLPVEALVVVGGHVEGDALLVGLEVASDVGHGKPDELIGEKEGDREEDDAVEGRQKDESDHSERDKCHNHTDEDEDARIRPEGHAMFHRCTLPGAPLPVKRSLVYSTRRVSRPPAKNETQE